MASLSSSLSIGLTGLQATQSAISVVGHNIANVNTENYTRQRADLAARHSVTLGTLTYGAGVNVTSIEGIRDKYLELQITQTTSRNSGASTRYTGLQTVDAIFQDDGTSGLSTLIENYFSAFQKLAASPEDSSVRTNLVGQAQNLVDGLQTRYSMLEQQRTQANEAVDSSVDEVNTLTSEIADLNTRISSNTTANSNSDAVDQRQALVNKLAELVGIQVYTDNNNQLQITLDSGAAVLVTGGLAATMSVQKGTGMNNDQVLVTTGGSSVNVTGDINEGSIGANLDLRDNILTGYEDTLDELAAGIVQQTNLQHRQGYALDGTTTGLDLFQGTSANGTDGLPSGITSADNFRGMVQAMTVNSDIVDDPSLIAAASASDPSPGNNENALLLAALQSQTGTVTTNYGGSTTGPFGTVVAGLVNAIGTDEQSYSANSTTQENLLAALQTQRSSVSGVDLDEEATSLIAYQRGYQACAHFISVIDSLTSDLLTQFGA